MKYTEPIRIFVDNCVISLSETMQGAFKEEEVWWGGTVYRLKIIGFERKAMPSENQAWKRKQIECLPTIGRIAKEKRILLYTYHELQNETWKRTAINNYLGNVFDGVEFHYVDAAVERSYFFQSELSHYLSNEQVVKFCKWLHTPNLESVVERLQPLGKYPKSLVSGKIGFIHR